MHAEYQDGFNAVISLMLDISLKLIKIKSCPLPMPLQLPQNQILGYVYFILSNVSFDQFIQTQQ
jgi:hypothetical protein